PLPSEAALFAYLQANPSSTALALAVATLGNTAGGMTSYLIGRFIPQNKLDLKTIGYLHRYGAPAVFFAWLPIVGDAVPVAAGWVGNPWPRCGFLLCAGSFLL